MNETWCALNISILKCFVLFLLHVHHTRSDSLASSYFQQLNSIAQEHLGVDKFEDFYNSIPTYILRKEKNETIWNITQRLESRLDASVNDIDRMIELLDDKSGDIQIRLCPNSSVPGYNFNIDFFNDVNLEIMCSNNVILNSVSQNFYNFVKDRYSSSYFRNKWYYTSETGPTVMYPAIVLPSTSDYRLRSSYINTISQKAKHVLLLFQSSISVTQVSNKMIMVANVILDSLSSRDRVGLVTFADGVVEPCVSGSIASHLVISEMKKYLLDVSYANNVNYEKAFDYSFTHFQDDYNAEVKTMLVMSTCERLQANLSNIIRNGEARNSNLVKIFILCFSDVSDETIKTWLNVTSRDNLMQSAGEGQNSEVINMFARMNAGADVRSILNEYFQKYLVTTSNGGVYHTNPYYDQTSLGLIISRCKAKKTGFDLKGVACIDFNVYDLFSEIDLFDLYSNMYPFLVNSDGKVILHPYLNPPSENYRDPFLPEISDLEQEDNGMNIDELEKCITKINIQCEIVADVKRVYPRGHLALHGIQWEIVSSHFICKAIKGLSFTVCLVFDANEKTYVKISLQNFPFTNSLTFMNSINIFDLTDKCSQNNRIALYNATSIVLAPKSFTNPNIYLGTNQSNLDFNNWKNIVAKLNDPQSTFKPGVVEDIHTTGFVDNFWKSMNNISFIVWKNIATETGVFRKYPGTMLSKDYDATRRPWFVQSTSEYGNLVFYGANVDYSLSGCYCGLTRAIPARSQNNNKKRSRQIYAAFNMYMTITYMEFILRQVFTDCNKSGYTCTVINRSGFVVLRINASHSLTACLVNQINQTNDNNMHINCEEPGLANTLIEKNILNAQFCVNYDDQNHNITKFWNVSMDSGMNIFENFQIHQIPNMNIFVIVKNGSFSAEARCNCGEKNFKFPACGKVLDRSCQYPCFFTKEVCANDSMNFSSIPPCVYTDVLNTPYKTPSTSFDNEKPLCSKVCPCSNLQCSQTTLPTLLQPLTIAATTTTSTITITTLTIPTTLSKPTTTSTEPPPTSSTTSSTTLSTTSTTLSSASTAATPTFPTSTSSNKNDSFPSLNVVSSSAPSSDVSQTQTLVPPSSPSSSRELGVGLGVGLSLLVIVLVAVALLFYFKRNRPLEKSEENHISHVYVGETESNAGKTESNAGKTESDI